MCDFLKAKNHIKIIFQRPYFVNGGREIREQQKNFQIGEIVGYIFHDFSKAKKKSVKIRRNPFLLKLIKIHRFFFIIFASIYREPQNRLSWNFYWTTNLIRINLWCQFQLYWFSSSCYFSYTSTWPTTLHIHVPSIRTIENM